jgi:hypothetical protein
MRKLPPDAFDYYASLGHRRSYEAVAKRYSVTKRAVTRRATAESWQQRLAQLEAHARQRSEEKLAETLEAVNSRHLQTLRVIQAKALQALKELPLDSASDAVRALATAIKQERIILGEPTERTAVAIEEVIKREYERWMVADEEPPPNGHDVV